MEGFPELLVDVHVLTLVRVTGFWFFKKMISQHLLDHSKSKRIPEKHLLLIHSLLIHKAFDYVDNNKLWKILQERGILITLPVSCETCMQVKKQQFEPNMEQWTGSKLG